MAETQLMSTQLLPADAEPPGSALLGASAASPLLGGTGGATGGATPLVPGATIAAAPTLEVSPFGEGVAPAAAASPPAAYRARADDVVVDDDFAAAETQPVDDDATQAPPDWTGDSDEEEDAMAVDAEDDDDAARYAGATCPAPSMSEEDADDDDAFFAAATQAVGRAPAATADAETDEIREDGGKRDFSEAAATAVAVGGSDADADAATVSTGVPDSQATSAGGGRGGSVGGPARTPSEGWYRKASASAPSVERAPAVVGGGGGDGGKESESFGGGGGGGSSGAPGFLTTATKAAAWENAGGMYVDTQAMAPSKSASDGAVEDSQPSAAAAAADSDSDSDSDSDTEEPESAPHLIALDLPPALVPAEISDDSDLDDDDLDDDDDDLNAPPPAWSAYRLDGAGGVKGATGIEAFADVGKDSDEEEKKPDPSGPRRSGRARKQVLASPPPAPAAAAKGGGARKKARSPSPPTRSRSRSPSPPPASRQSIPTVSEAKTDVRCLSPRAARAVMESAKKAETLPRTAKRRKSFEVKVVWSRSPAASPKSNPLEVVEEEPGAGAAPVPAATRSVRGGKPPPARRGGGGGGGARTSPARKKLRTATTTAVKVLVSSALAAKDVEATTTAIKKLGGEVTTSTRDFTHFLTAKPLGRSKNVLCALMMGRPIVTETWVTASTRAGGFVDAGDHLCRDLAFERAQGFDMKATLENARDMCVFRQRRIHVIAPSKGAVAGKIGLIVELASIANAAATETEAEKSAPDDVVIVAATGEKSAPDERVSRRWRNKGYDLYDPEDVLRAIVKHQWKPRR